MIQYFVSQEIDPLIEQNVIGPLAQTLIDHDFELAPMLKQLFKSEHFFDERALGVIIKSPFDVIFNFINESEFYYSGIMYAFIYYTGLFGQIIFDPLEQTQGHILKYLNNKAF